MSIPFEEKYFYEDKYDTDIDHHTIPSGAASADNTSNIVKAKEAYKLSQRDYSVLKRDNSLIAGAVADPVFKHRSEANKSVFYEDRQKTLEKLLVNSTTADRYIETKNYNKQLQNVKDARLAAGFLVQIQKEKSKKAADAQKSRTIIDKFNDFLKNLFILNPTAFMKWVGTINLYRLSWTFSRISIKNLLLYLQSIGVLDQNGSVYGVSFNTKILDAPNTVFNYLSVYLFLAKIMVNISLPFKHAFAPTNEAEKGIDWWTRFKIELNREWVNFLNDSWWVMLNAVTNFPKAFGLSIPVAGWILTGALFFDATLLVAVSYYEEKEIAEKISWLKRQIESKDPAVQQHIPLFKSMLKQAEIQREGFRTLIKLILFATALFVASLALTLSLASPIVAPVGFLACVIAVAFILSREEAAAVAEARAARYYDANKVEEQYKDAEEIQIMKEHGSEIKAELKKSEEEAWKTFGLNFAEHVFVPMIIVGVYTICWPAAIVLTIMYVACKCIDFQGHKEGYHDNNPGDVGGGVNAPSLEFSAGGAGGAG